MDKLYYQPHFLWIRSGRYLLKLKINYDRIFCSTFEESLKDLETRQGAVVKGTIVAIQKGFVLVDTGSKSESAIPSEEFLNAQGELEVQVGDVVDVVLKAVDDGFGETVAPC